MPKLWKFRSKSEQEEPKVEAYHFAEAQELPSFEEEDLPPEEEAFVFSHLIGGEDDLEAEEPPPFREELSRVEAESDNPVRFAQVQSDTILREAELQAQQILDRAEAQAQQIRELAREKGQEEGYQLGFQQGLADGTAQALEEGNRAKEETARQMIADVESFLWKADRALNRQLDENLNDLRDLALAVAEKVVCVSLKSSSEVIGRMIQTAVAKRKRREWAHIYIAECDAKKLTTMPASLAAAMSELSDRVQIIPMAGDEAGTVLIESPNEIIDASASTQMQNIRDMLSSRSGGSMNTGFNFSEQTF